MTEAHSQLVRDWLACDPVTRRLLHQATDPNALLGWQEHVRLRVMPGADDEERQYLLRLIHHWHRCAFDSTYSSSSSGELTMERSARAFDFRQGHERDQVPTRMDLFPQAVARSLYSMANDWGLASGWTTSRLEFDQLLLPAGTAGSTIERIRLVSHLLRSGLKVGSVVAFAARRDVSSREIADARRLMGMGGDGTEAAVMADALDGLWPLGQTALPEVHEVGAVAGKRPGTRECLSALSGKLTSGRTLLITSGLYSAQQALAAASALPIGTELVVVSTPSPVAAPGSAESGLRCQHVAQELRATVDASSHFLSRWTGEAVHVGHEI